MTNWKQERHAAQEEVEALAVLLRDEDTTDRRLIAGYLEAKRVLARAFEQLAVEKYSDNSHLESAKIMIEHAMRSTFTQIPEKYLRVSGFSRVHAMLLAYLVPRVGTAVYADELRMLTGDAVHTERRARDLRDLGFALLASDHPGGQAYTLVDSVPAAQTAAVILIHRNIRQDKTLSENSRARLLRLAGIGIPPEQE
ncbi:hypothetical protein [Pseudarthrobacter sp. GA104]|uniref:hypothetical protein n=1 Tax=Pseudarthrobacter sp. GA104 TaxID=2676311 RepID=UPI0012F91F39|nr:hypothetical protein [Pseudarthrobacter sp. GA104]MUU70537.1 hypothetical protein [Pseudarthrobacter sp. GA104]